MLTRRNFLKGLLSSVAAGALIRNGIVQPEQVIEEPQRRIFDMGAHTYRKALLGLPGLRGYWPMDGVPFHVNCRCALPMPLRLSQELLDDACGAWDWSSEVQYTAQWYEQLESAYQKGANDLS